MEDPTRRLAPYFRAVCIEIRERRGRSHAYVADLLDLSQVSIQRFEDGRTFPTANFETYAAAYAELDGIDPRDLLRRAIDYWLEIGNPPLTPKQAARLSDAAGDPFSPEAILRHITQAETQRATRRETGAARPTATRRNRAGGE